MNRVDLDRVPAGNSEPTPVEFPLPSLRQFLMPDQTVKVKTFVGGSADELDGQINKWVYETKNIIAIVGPLASMSSGYSLSVTYVQASKNYKNV
tara:strand:+ start:1431 stop:1712 length:282 start_codon:yes stop_codon:yes gene_type:complete